jgi:hypothetical protein
MDETTSPTPAVTPPTPDANGQAPEPPATSRPDAGDPDKLPLSPEGWEYLADKKWINEQFNLGRFEAYAGNYIAVYRKQLLGFGPNVLVLREQTARDHNVSPDRIATSYVEPPIES